MDTELAGHLRGVSREEFISTKAHQRVAERLLEIAGEAATNIEDGILDDIEADWEGIRAMRVLLAHAYRKVDPGPLWEAAKRDLPRLAGAVREFLLQH